MYYSEEEKRKRYRQEQKEKHYDQAKKLIAETENRKNYETGDDYLLEEQNSSVNRFQLPAICFSIIFGILGCGFFSMGVCIIAGVFLKSLLWLGIVFLCFSVLIIASIYPIYKKIVFYLKVKSQFQIDKEEHFWE